MSRAGKSGDAYRTEQKLEQRYDDEDALGTPGHIIDWISGSMSGEIDAIGGRGWQDIQKWLGDGVVLCKLINKLLAETGKEKVSFKAKAKTAFVAMANIESFNTGAKSYGLNAEALFQTTDLVDGRKGPMINVVNCLSSLGFLANSKGHSPKYEAPEPPKFE